MAKSNPEGSSPHILRFEVMGRSFAVLRLPAAALAWNLLTRAEREVAALAHGGLSNAEIARRRGASIRTVETQLSTVYRKLGLRSRADLVALARVPSVEDREE